MECQTVPFALEGRVWISVVMSHVYKIIKTAWDLRKQLEQLVGFGAECC